MKKLREDLKNRTFEKVYLLYGEEDYLRSYWYGKLKEALDQGDSMNVRYADADTVSPESVRDFTDTMPFFADRRVLFLNDTGLFASASDAYAGWLPSLPDTACVIFNEKRVDKRNKLSRKPRPQATRSSSRGRPPGNSRTGSCAGSVPRS